MSGREASQQALNQRMLPPINLFTLSPMKRLVEDCNFGPKTQAMVKEFQRLNDLEPDGIIGPTTSYFIFPYISFNAGLAGRGIIRNIRSGLYTQQSNTTRQSAFSQLNVSNRSGNVFGDQTVGENYKHDDKEKEKRHFEMSLNSNTVTTPKPWFKSIKPNDEHLELHTETTLTIESIIMRKKGFEIVGEADLGLISVEGKSSNWEWAGKVTGSYPIDAKFFNLSPIADLSVKREGLSASLGVEAKASIDIIDDKLELSVGGKVAGGWDSQTGVVRVGAEIQTALKLKWDIERIFRK